MTEYEEVGMKHLGLGDAGFLRVTSWAPKRTDAQKLRDHMLKPGFGGKDYGLTDTQLDEYIAKAKKRIGGLRQSWVAVAHTMIKQDHGDAPTEAEKRARFDRTMRDVARRESGWR